MNGITPITSIYSMPECCVYLHYFSALLVCCSGEAARSSRSGGDARTPRALGAHVLHKCLDRRALTKEQVDNWMRGDSEEQMLLFAQERAASGHADQLLDALERLGANVESVANINEWLARLEHRLRALS